jgi:hypothetical protein
MDEPVFDQGMSDNILTHIREGMDVYDGKDKKVGTVDVVYFGAVSQEDDERGLGPQSVSRSDEPNEGTTVAGFAFGGVISPVDDLGDVEEVLRKRMLREGFVKVDTSGLFSSDVFVLPDQIESISNEAIHLRVSQDKLINS